MSRWSVSCAVLLAVGAGTLPAQRPVPARLALFLDCHTRCDTEYLRTELTLVDWVTDRTAADVHVIASGLRGGAGGRVVTLEFIGRNALAGRSDTVTFDTPPDATDDTYREEFARVLRLGLVPYLLAARQADNLALEVAAPATGAIPTATSDPWNHWIFTVGADGEVNTESSQKNYQFGGKLRANRTTENWKLRFNLEGDLDRTSFTLEDGGTFTARRDEWNFWTLAVRSRGPHWSIGATGSLRGSKPDNLDLRARLAPAIEWDLFPYAEATRRQLIVIYSLGLTHYDYVETTIYDKLAETRLDHALKVAYQVRQPWGSAQVSGTASTFLHDWSRNRLSIRGGLDIRVARGLQLQVEGSYSRVRDQITLRKGDASDEEVFLRLRELATDYRANLQIGMSYTFGSFFNSIVNPRFDELD